MALEITQDAINKLTHHNEEIRIRALEQIETKLARALGHQVPVVFKPTELCKQLIRSFKYQSPAMCSARILGILVRLLESPYGNEVIGKIGIERLRAELCKLRNLLQEKRLEKQLLTKIDDILFEHEKNCKDGSAKPETNDIVCTMDALSLYNANDGSAAHTFNYSPENYELSWSKPAVADYNSLKIMADVLATSGTTVEEKNNVLQHLQTTMVDYPAEYMLQSPHLFIRLIRLCGSNSVEHDKQLQGKVFSTLLSFLTILKQCLRKRYKIDSYAAQKTTSTHNKASTFGQTQLKISKAIEILLEKCLEHLETQTISVRRETICVMEILMAVIEIVEEQQLYFEPKYVARTERISAHLMDLCKHDENHTTLARTRHIWLTFMLYKMIEINGKRSQYMEQYKLIVQQLLDFSLQHYIPNLYACIKKLIFNVDIRTKQSYEHLQERSAQLKSCIEILKQENFEPRAVIEKSIFVLPVLDNFKSLKLIDLILNAILSSMPFYTTEEQLKIQAMHLLHKLLQLQTESLKSFVYKSIATSVRKHFAALMNQETICSGIQNQQLLSTLVIGIPLNTSILQQIINDNFECDCAALRKNAEEIIILLLRSHHFYENSWNNLRDIFSPNLPLLLCCAPHSIQISEVLLRLLDPDSNFFSLIDFLRGNIGLMFVENCDVRNEALTRLIYILNSLPQSTAYLPNISEISDVLSNDLCVPHNYNPREIQHIFSANESNNEITALQTLLVLLDTPETEPKVRQSTLMQLNILCKNWDMTASFCDEQAYCLVLSALENALKRDSSTDYVESVIPTISILSKLLIYDSDFRRELSDIPNVYILLLRALFYFSQDIQLRQDVSICLFLLVFGRFLVVVPRGGGCGDIEAPQLFKNLKIPMKCKFLTKSWTCINQRTPSYRFDEAESNAYLRQVIACTYFKNPTFSKREIEQLNAALDICPTLLLEQRDAHYIRASNFCHNMHAIMRTVSNATDQKTLVKCGNTLRQQLMLHYMDCDGASKTPSLPSDIANGIFSLFSRYLQVTPGNVADIQVYECVLDLFQFCVRRRVVPIITQLKSVLRTDFQHGLFLILKNPELPLDMYLQVSKFLKALLSAWRDIDNSPDRNFRSNLFELFHTLSLKFYVSRNLQRMRCLLNLMQALTNVRLELPEQTLYKHNKSFLKFSKNMKSLTQTGAQWHRDCLMIFIQIFIQVPDVLKLRFPENTLSHMIGLCGHRDVEVRALAWICLSLFANVKEPTSDNCGTGSSRISGTQLITSQLTDLPGGFIGCCLCTFLDECEMILVRHYAGNLFVLLLEETCSFDKALLLLERHTFFATAYDSLETCVFERILPIYSPLVVNSSLEHGDGACAAVKLATCEMVIIYCRICIAIIKLKPDYVNEICEKLLLFKLYELIKLPLVSTNTEHYDMCAQICHLYALCSEQNFAFLQQTLCHDDRWLSRLFDLLDPPKCANETSIVCILQLTLALCREEFVFYRLCARLSSDSNILQSLFTRTLTIARISSSLQRTTLAIFEYLLIKSQSANIGDKKNCFINALEKENDVSQRHLETIRTIDIDNNFSETDKENIVARKNSFKNVMRASDPGDLKENDKFVASKIFIQQLYKIFLHLYPCDTFKFDSPPGATRTQVCETLALLLKLSPVARETANSLRLLHKVLLTLETFLREFGSNGTTFIRRYGEVKKSAIIKNLKILFQILLYWFSPNAGVLVDEMQCSEVAKIIMQSWSWLEHSLDLKYLVVQVCSFLSERSLTTCAQFSSYNSAYSHSVLQKIIKVVTTETNKAKTLNAMHLSIVAVGLRIMMNCCVCTEGRFTLLKEHVLDHIEGLHPFNMKSPKIRLELLHNWLQFWELFSRYNEGGQARNLSALCHVINRSSPFSKTRLLCLKILRNMSFVVQNRSLLMVSADFLYTANEVISQPLSSALNDHVSCEEQLIISVAIWQIVSGGIKYVSMLRGTKMFCKLRNLREKLLALHEINSLQLTKLPHAIDLTNVLEILNIFSEK